MTTVHVAKAVLKFIKNPGCYHCEFFPVKFIKTVPKMSFPPGPPLPIPGIGPMPPMMPPPYAVPPMG
ncbi:UNVERIFIED_CONTAM: hypothetical protein NCL1_31287 [Trichonephila clavipes]